MRHLPLILALALSSALAAPSEFSQTVTLRGNLDNSRLQFEKTKKGSVAFLGGSITEMDGYRPLVCEFLEKRFPQTAFTFTNAGIGSTCSNTGAFRLRHDILDKGPIDLLFVEFAVNDDQDGHFSREECIRGMEGIIRQARLRNPAIDIVMTFFVNEGMINAYKSGKTPLSIDAHDSVAKAYDIPAVNVAKELTAQITSGAMTWEQYGGVHPAAPGARLASAMIENLLTRAWERPPTRATAHALPPRPLDALSYFNGRFIDPSEAAIKSGWTLAVPDWNSLPGGKRDRFTSIPMLSATEPGAELTLDFEGTSIGAYIVSGPDAGIVEASVDGKPFRPVNLFTPYSDGLHYPWTVMLGAGLKPGKHTLTLRISPDTGKTGHAMRIMQFTAG